MKRREFIENAVHVGAMAAVAAWSLPGSVARAAPRDEVVLITGTSSGFGQRMALTFARAGYRTYATMREPRGRNAAKASYLSERARDENLALFVEELDVTASDQARALIETLIGREGRIDTLINNAGAFVYSPIEVAPPELWDYQMRVNVFGPMDLVGLVMPHMRARGSGLVIQMSSRVGRVLVPGISLYATSKFALEAATEAAHYESTPFGIDFAIVQPTAFDTDINRNARRIFREISLPLIHRLRPQGASAHKRMIDKLDSDFSGQPTRNPQEVAELALAIARMPRAERVLRYPVGDDRELAAVRSVNAFTARLQAQVLNEAGYGGLYRP